MNLGGRSSAGVQARSQEAASYAPCSENLGLDGSYEHKRNIRCMKNKNLKQYLDLTGLRTEKRMKMSATLWFEDIN